MEFAYFPKHLDIPSCLDGPIKSFQKHKEEINSFDNDGTNEKRLSSDDVLNIITPDSSAGDTCIPDGNWTTWGWMYPKETLPVPTWACASNGNTWYSNSQFSGTVGHEIVHSLGLGHAWFKSNDLMCSSELRPELGGKVSTCPNTWNKSSIPSDFDLAALVYLYGKV